MASPESILCDEVVSAELKKLGYKNVSPDLIEMVKNDLSKVIKFSSSVKRPLKISTSSNIQDTSISVKPIRDSTFVYKDYPHFRKSSPASSCRSPNKEYESHSEESSGTTVSCPATHNVETNTNPLRANRYRSYEERLKNLRLSIYAEAAENCRLQTDGLLSPRHKLMYDYKIRSDSPRCSYSETVKKYRERKQKKIHDLLVGSSEVPSDGMASSVSSSPSHVVSDREKTENFNEVDAIEDSVKENHNLLNECATNKIVENKNISMKSQIKSNQLIYSNCGYGSHIPCTTQSEIHNGTKTPGDNYAVPKAFHIEKITKAKLTKQLSNGDYRQTSTVRRLTQSASGKTEPIGISISKPKITDLENGNKILSRPNMHADIVEPIETTGRANRLNLSSAECSKQNIRFDNGSKEKEISAEQNVSESMPISNDKNAATNTNENNSKLYKITDDNNALGNGGIHMKHSLNYNERTKEPFSNYLKDPQCKSLEACDSDSISNRMKKISISKGTEQRLAPQKSKYVSSNKNKQLDFRKNMIFQDNDKLANARNEIDNECQNSYSNDQFHDNTKENECAPDELTDLDKLQLDKEKYSKNTLSPDKSVLRRKVKTTQNGEKVIKVEYIRNSFQYPDVRKSFSSYGSPSEKSLSNDFSPVHCVPSKSSQCTSPTQSLQNFSYQKNNPAKKSLPPLKLPRFPASNIATGKSKSVPDSLPISKLTSMKSFSSHLSRPSAGRSLYNRSLNKSNASNSRNTLISKANGSISSQDLSSNGKSQSSNDLSTNRSSDNITYLSNVDLSSEKSRSTYSTKLHLRKRNRKSDPLAMYNYYKKFWDNFAPPGEKKHLKLRWAIRDKMVDYDPVWIS